MSKASAKRPHEVECIDLTSDDPPSSRPTKTPRVHSDNSFDIDQTSQQQFPASSSQQPFSTPFRQAADYRNSYYQHQIGLTPGNPFEIDDDDDYDVTATGQNLDRSSYGELDTLIVGCRYYPAQVQTGERLQAIREPSNQHDRNSIRVDNFAGQIVGHLDRRTTGILAPYLDSKGIALEITARGVKRVFDCPITIFVKGPYDMSTYSEFCKDAARIGTAKFRHAAQPPQPVQPPMYRQSEWYDANGGPGASTFPGLSTMMDLTHSPQPVPHSLEDIMRESERFNPRSVVLVTEELAIKEEELAKMPKAQQPKALKLTLLPYQLQGLQWLLDKENPVLSPRGSSQSVQLWHRLRKNSSLFEHKATFETSPNPYLASGGILADDMGLGKTVQIIALLVADKTVLSSELSGATLIMAPLSVMSNWSGQIKQHLKSGSALKVLTWHGANKIKLTPSVVAEYDVVITTYESMSAEYWSVRVNDQPAPVPRPSGLFSIKWRRLVLDEGHNIRNPGAKKSIAACHLIALSRWVLTGTPIINSLKDLYSITKFLGLSGGLNVFELFNNTLIRPVHAGHTKAYRLLQDLMQSICLRRKKDMSFIDLRLPECKEYVHHIDFKKSEREKYDALSAQAKTTLELFKNATGTEAQKQYRCLLEILLRMRQMCNHHLLLGEERLKNLEEFMVGGTVNLTPENVGTLQTMLQLSIDSRDDCPICMDTYKDPIITKCTHVFCYGCIEKAIDPSHKCPLCRAELVGAQDFVRPAEEEEDKEEEIDTDEHSSKTKALMTILDASRHLENTKTVVFSQWTSFLDIAQGHIHRAGFEFTRIDGKMNPAQRDAAMERLANDPDCTILLASLSVCSVGLNLVAANQVILVDSWWAPAIEDQAIDRVHRLGQTRETTVFRLVIENTVEDHVLEIQEQKRKLMALAFAEKEAKRGQTRTARLADIERLLRT